jgi:hypothetical protein
MKEKFHRKDGSGLEYPYYLYAGKLEQMEEFWTAERELVFKSIEEISEILKIDINEDLFDLYFNVVEFENWGDHQYVPLQFKNEYKVYLKQLLELTEMQMAYLVIDVINENGEKIKIRYNSDSARPECKIIGILFERIKT